MNPYLSWAIVLFVAAGLGWYYTSRPTPKAKTASIKAIAEKSEHAFTNKKPKRKIRKSPDDPPTSLPLAPPLKREFETHGIQQTAFAASDKVEGGIGNHELARQFKKANESASASGKLNGLEKKGRRVPK